METVKLISNKKNTTELVLYKDRPVFSIENFKTQKFVYDNLFYTLLFDKNKFNKRIEVYLDEDSRDIYEGKGKLDNNGKIKFISVNYPESETLGYTFRSMIGFYNLIIVLRDKKKEEKYYSEFFCVLSRYDNYEEKENASKMLTAVSEEFIDLELTEGNIAVAKENKKGVFKEGEKNFNSLRTEIDFLDHIRKLYEENIGYFKTNRRIKVERTESIESIKKLNNINHKTIEYLVRNVRRPFDDLSQDEIGIMEILPEKVLMPANRHTINIYENRVIVGFLKEMVVASQALRERYNKLVDIIIGVETKYGESNFILSGNIIVNNLIAYKEEIDGLIHRFSQLHSIYVKYLPVDDISVKTLPYPTSTLLSIPEYRHLYNAMYTWFGTKEYAFEKEKLLLSIPNIDFFYEYYVLMNLVYFFKNNGFIISNSTNMGWGGKNYHIINDYYIFEREEKVIEFYYEPVINQKDKKKIGLTCASKRTPDFVIKWEENNRYYYLLLDAKFKNFSSTKTYDVNRLEERYLTDIKPVGKSNIIKGLILACGKADSKSDKVMKLSHNISLVFLAENCSKKDRMNYIKNSMEEFIKWI